MNNVNEKLSELINLIKNQEEVINYNKIEAKLKDNQYVNEKLNDFRKLQQKHVLYETKNGQVPAEIHQRYEDALNDLIEIPIYNEYLFLQNEINEMIQQITLIIENEVNSELNRI